ncbi:hypothetical protein KUTeg_017068 [Tegillarca granosa]|uniref:Phosphatidic acid phosphatase type 2/haloperoxidase domain-containing protein n=1 Tax=Tegillarca granosa TaxID=220873 RepID=A0ABQ9ETA2_TEGGR|nr:hypothetical protein KUTeg_017068 [Tegillarca granosa]
MCDILTAMATVNGAVVFKVLIDIFCLSVVAGEPFHRGFYCDDESLMHPHKPDTVPTWVASTVAIVLPLIFIVLIEGHQLSIFRRNCSCYSISQSRPYLITLYRSIGSFFFGAAVTQLTTDVAKYSIGRLRPHFLTLLSFPSGHTSITVYSMVFIIIFLQIKIKWRKSWLLRPFIQAILFYMTYLTSLSRITDYMHHWSDVLGGAIIGLTESGSKDAGIEIHFLLL